ncbi:MAG: hypothetical protein LAO79_19460, partial [Acidobacteriia bacterium]|nr:hypothetical protein [Terriglobia bacterium]
MSRSSIFAAVRRRVSIDSPGKTTARNAIIFAVVVVVAAIGLRASSGAVSVALRSQGEVPTGADLIWEPSS